jgi:sarcosine/dimethylglycine N-methyltransferase
VLKIWLEDVFPPNEDVTVNDKIDVVRQHYEGDVQATDLLAKVEKILEQLGNGPVTSAQLAGLDQFHGGGLKTTAEFIKLLNIQPRMKVLDAGSGLGGPSRYTAENFDCHVTGVDLTEAFVAVSKVLAKRTGMEADVSYQVGNLLALELPDGQFDVVYTQHVVMNIRDRAQVYAEVSRVLKPGGVFGFYDVLAVDGHPEPQYPLPWAESSDSSVLLTEVETRAALEQAGLVPQVWKDVTEEMIKWFEQQQMPALQGPAKGPSLMLVMGPRFAQMAANFAQNLRENRIRLVMATNVRS